MKSTLRETQLYVCFVGYLTLAQPRETRRSRLFGNDVPRAGTSSRNSSALGNGHCRSVELNSSSPCSPCVCIHAIITGVSSGSPYNCCLSIIYAARLSVSRGRQCSPGSRTRSRERRRAVTDATSNRERGRMATDPNETRTRSSAATLISRAPLLTPPLFLSGFRVEN